MNIGDKAPEILGKDEQGRAIRLSDYKGRKLVLYFYPKDNTSGCTAEACSLRDHYGELQGAFKKSPARRWSSCQRLFVII
jgi:peroxiredoxin Q/BCP